MKRENRLSLTNSLLLRIGLAEVDFWEFMPFSLQLRDTGSGEDKGFRVQQMQLGSWALPLSGYKALGRSPVLTDAHHLL